MWFSNKAWIITISFFPAMMLALIPLPDTLVYLRPAWIPMFILFWIIKYPNFIGLYTSWCIGLLLDILTGVLLGQYAMSLLLSTKTSLLLQKRFKRANMFEQLFIVLLVTLAFQVTYLWVGIAFDKIHFSFLYFLPVLTSTILWPLVMIALKKLCWIYSI